MDWLQPKKDPSINIVDEVPSPENYGIVYLDNYSRKAGVVSVVFDHWLHREGEYLWCMPSVGSVSCLALL